MEFLRALSVYICFIPAVFLFGGIVVKKILQAVGALEADEPMYIEVPSIVFTENIIDATIEAYQRGLPAGASRVGQRIIVLWDKQAPRSYEEKRYKRELEDYISRGINNNVEIREF